MTYEIFPCDSCKCNPTERAICVPIQKALRIKRTSTGPVTKSASSPANAKQVAGDHYKQYGNLQPWDVIIAWKMDYLTGTALKYLARWKDKGGIDDLKKAIHFIEKQIEVAEAEAEAAAKIPNQS